jgi:hypothetical protein
VRVLIWRLVTLSCMHEAHRKQRSIFSAHVISMFPMNWWLLGTRKRKANLRILVRLTPTIPTKQTGAVARTPPSTKRSKLYRDFKS